MKIKGTRTCNWGGSGKRSYYSINLRTKWGEEVVIDRYAFPLNLPSASFTFHLFGLQRRGRTVSQRASNAVISNFRQRRSQRGQRFPSPRRLVFKQDPGFQFTPDDLVVVLFGPVLRHRRPIDAPFKFLSQKQPQQQQQLSSPASSESASDRLQAVCHRGSAQKNRR